MTENTDKQAEVAAKLAIPIDEAPITFKMIERSGYTVAASKSKRIDRAPLQSGSTLGSGGHSVA